MDDKVVEDLLIRLARLSTQITIVSSSGKLKTDPPNPDDSDYRKVESVLRDLISSGMLFMIEVKSSGIYLSFTDTDAWEQFKRVVESKLGPNCDCLPCNANTLCSEPTVVGFIKFNPQKTNWLH